MSKVIEQSASGGQGFYASAGSVADEVIRMIRTIIAFDTQEREIERYSKELEGARKAGEKGGLVQGIGVFSLGFHAGFGGIFSFLFFLVCV
mgnify:CR=1 FL=1